MLTRLSWCRPKMDDRIIIPELTLCHDFQQMYLILKATIPSHQVVFLPDLATDTALLWQLPDRNNINNQMNCKRQFVPAAEFHAWFEIYPLLWNQMQHKVLQCCLANYWSSAYGYLPGERNLSILYQTDWTRPKVCLHPEVVRNSIVFMVWIDKVTTYWV